MKIFLLLAAPLLAVPAAASTPKPKPPAPADVPPVETRKVIHVTPGEFARAKDEVDLDDLLREDLENTNKGVLDLKLRDRINVILLRLAKEY